MKRPRPMISSAPVCRYIFRWNSISSFTIRRLRSRTATISIGRGLGAMPNSAPRRAYDATFAEWMTFLLGRHAMFGHDPPTYRRSTTATRFPSAPSAQASSLPALPLPSTTSSYSSMLAMTCSPCLRIVTFIARRAKATSRKPEKLQKPMPKGAERPPAASRSHWLASFSRRENLRSRWRISPHLTPRGLSPPTPWMRRAGIPPPELRNFYPGLSRVEWGRG